LADNKPGTIGGSLLSTQYHHESISLLLLEQNFMFWFTKFTFWRSLLRSALKRSIFRRIWSNLFQLTHIILTCTMRCIVEFDIILLFNRAVLWRFNRPFYSTFNC